MKKTLFIAILALSLACGTPRPTLPAQLAQPTLPPTIAPTPTPALLGSVTGLTFFFEHEHQFDCDVSGNHWRCVAPDGLTKLTLFGDPVTEATISVPFDAAAGKPSKYVVSLLFQTGLDNTAWDWLVSHMEQPETSKEFGDRRVTTQTDDEGWLVTVEALR